MYSNVYDKVSIGLQQDREGSIIHFAEATRLSTVKPIQSCRFLSSLRPSALDLPWIRHTRVIRKQHSPALFGRKAADPPGLRKIGTAVCSQAIRKTTMPTPFPDGGTSPSPTSRGLRRVQGWQLPPGRAPSSRFLRILTPSLVSPSVFFLSSCSVLLLSHTLRVLSISSLRFIAVYRSAKSRGGPTFLF